MAGKYGYRVSWETGHFDYELGERLRQSVCTESEQEAEEVAATKRDLGYWNVVIDKVVVRG